MEETINVSEILRKYPDRIPIFVKTVKPLVIDKKKYLVPRDLTVGQFIYVCRKRINLTPEQSVFIFFNKVLPSTSKTIQEIYEENKAPNGILVATLATENTFGYLYKVNEKNNQVDINDIKFI